MMMFEFNGVRSDTYNVLLADRVKWDTPKRDYERVVIPGRNGTLTLDNKRFDDASGTIRCYTVKEWHQSVEDLKAFLMQDVSRHRFVDDIEPDVYRLARVVNVNVVSHDAANTALVEIELNMAPEKWLIADDIPVAVGTVSITNPTHYAAKPLIVAAGDGTITFNGCTITLSGVSGPTTIDCETLNAYATGSENSHVTITGTPVFPAGAFQLTTTVALTITPRWWTI